MDIMVRKVNDSKLVGVDSLSYILQLEKILFDEIQREENINITVFRNNNLRNEEKTTGASAMIVINHDNIKTNPYGNSYYLYTPNANVIPMTQEEVQIMFNNQTFGYIGKEGMKISGIDNFGGPRR